MAEEHTQQPTPRGKGRRERVEYARSRDILDVASELNMELVRSGRDYRWKEHDSMVISPDKNMWNWFSRHQGGDVISLVETMKEVNFNQAIDYLNDSSFKEYTAVERVQEPFSYYLEPYEQSFEAARTYLKEQRGLSDETIDFFLDKGVLAQANAKVNGSIEPVVVFKSFDFSGEIVGATLQGIEENWEKWPERGYAKNIVRNSDGITGLHVDIGQPNRLIFAESAIDLMSYYELHKDTLQDVRLISMDGVKEAVIGRHLAQLQSELSGRPLRWSYDQLAEGLQTAIDNNFFTDGKHADWITLAVDNDEAGRNFIDSLREKGATINEDLPDLQPGQEKTDWNDALKNPPVDNSRLGQAKRKLERLNNEFMDATDAVYSHSAMANGQPMNDKRNGAAFFKRQEQLENKVFNKLDEIKKQEERVERLEQQQRFKEEGLNRKGNGLDMSVQNIPRIREELEKAERGESHYTRETIKRYREELKRLESISEQMSSVTIQPSTQALIDDGSVNQWAKQPNLYFVKGLRRVAVELTEEGTFVPSTKYRPRTDEEKAVLDNLLNRQNDVDLPGISSVEPEQKEESIPGQTEGEQGVLFENLADVTPSSDHAMEPELQVVFDFSENPKLSKQYSSGEVIPYNDFIAKLYEENDWQLIIPDSGYDKTYFALQDESGNSLISSIRYDIGSEREDLSEQLNQDLPAPYLELAQKADHDYRAQVSYDTFKANQERLSEAVQSQIQAGALRITLSDEAYFYTLVNYTGWSHPMQQLKPKALENLKEYRTFFESINDTNIDRFKEKGTPEQNQMYDILKSIQKELGRSNTSTVFSAEVAVSAYNLNRQLDSLTAENWGKSIVDPLGALGRDTWNIISYPANEIVTGNVDYYYQLVPYHLLDYLNGKTGTVEISPETYDHILQQLRNEEVIITPEAAEEVAVSSEQTISSDEETEKPLEVHQGQDVSEQQKNERMYQRKGYLQPEAEGSTSPVLETSTFERSVTSRPTVSSQYLNFSIKDGFKSRKTKYEKSIDAYNLGKLNRRGVDIQEAAQFYLNELANSTVHYFTSDGSLVQVNFLEENFLHLTGLKIIGDAATPEKVLHDFANGGELSYDDIRLKNTESPFDKIKVLPDLETVLQTDSFYFDDLQDIPRYQRRFDSLIKSDDSDLMLLFRMNTEDGTVPVSVFKARQVLKVELQEARKNEILGIFRERGGLIEQIDINKNYVKDDGEEMLSILKNKQYEESRDIDDRSMNVSSYSFNHQDYSDIDSLLAAGSAYVQTTEGQEWLARDPEYHQELLDIFESATATPKQKLEVMSEFGNIQVNGYDIVAGLGYSEALSDDALSFDQNVISEITEQEFSPEKALPTDTFSAELFTKVLDSAYNVGDPRELGLQVPEESKGAWERYYELSDSHEGNFSAVVDAADQLGLVDKNSNFYQEWNQDRIFSETYHVRLQWSETWPDGPQIPFKETELVDYQIFAETLYKENKAFYERHHGSVAEVNATGNQEAYIPFTKVKFDVYAPGGTLIKSDVRYDIGDETEPISRLLGLGYRRLEGQPELAAIDEMVLSQLENQEVNQNIAAEANEQAVASQEIPESISSEDFQSPKQGIRTGLAQRVEEIMAEDATKILVASIPQVQENLSVEGDLIGTPQADGQMLYTNQENFGRDYRLELAVHSPVKIDQLSDIQAPWTLELIQGEQKLGYLAYGGDWGNDFQVKKELEKLASQIGTGNSPEGLYKQEEIDAFLTNNGRQEPSQRIQENISSAEPFDYKSASAYEISERAFQKIREYTQSPEDLMEYVEFMSKFPQLSPRNVALIQDQWRGANAVATYDQWQSMGEALGIKPEDVIQTKATYVNKRTGETKEVVHQGLSVKTGEKSQITLFRPLMVRMIPVLDENGHQVKNDKGNPKYKKFSDATPQEKALVKDGKLPVRQFQERDPKTGYPRFTTYKVFELSQTTLKSESYPKAMPNRHYNFNTDQVKTKEVLEGLCDYAETIGITMMKDEAHVLGNAKGAFYSGEQLILINPDNTPGEKIATTIHELAHATLHTPKLADQYKELPKGQKEFEAEMTSHLLSKHFGLDTSEKAIDYMASWTDNLKALDDKQLADSLKRVHQTVSKMHKQIENHTKPYPLGKNRGQAPNFPKAPTKGPSR
ncbi:PBECR4 domain-containing protein [Streptococcus anginosus]|uniref:PBECR4 domain-containing protein n=1 Tax=Streptococcus anginosus TaxID=1328 RepID=UPI00232F1A4A|nr:PBECR4 domain-containing protein [Streptococcus anginosus]MDB8655404.1 PBECR4 domain-containing protein [Streptococcus anginosus]MDB8658913.1 PBECR4 domain-containing protein [Streptococcus anginosus]